MSDSNPISENSPTSDAQSEANVQTSRTNPDVPPYLSLSHSQPSEARYHYTSNPEKDWWDKAKPFVEIVGIILLAISTDYTIKMYDANKAAADAAKSAAETASAAFAQSKIDSAAQDRRSRETMETSAKQSKAALDASIEISRTDQRAWLGYQEVTDVALTSADTSSKIVVWYINTGKTPALEFKGHASTKLVYPGQVFVPEYPKTSDEPSMSYVMPEQRAHIQIGAAAPWDPAAIAALKGGRVGLYVFSEICYKDIFGAQHHSTFCGRVMPPELTGVANCGTYNEADDKPTDFCKSRQPTR